MVSETRVEAHEEHQPLYVWQLPVRLTHWVHVGAMALLAISGYYIGAPFLDTSGYSAAQYSMGIMRFLHAIGATFLTLSFVVRIYWAIVGNSYARFQALLPTTQQKRRDFVGQLKYYLLLSTKRPDYVGHNPVAGISYVALYILVFAQIFTGFALYSEFFPHSFWWTVFGWAFRWIAQDNVLRLVHHVLMWAFLIFFLVHIYLAVLNDLVERSGLNSSIVTGYKCHRPPSDDQV